MDDVVYPIKYVAPDGHKLRKAYVSPSQDLPVSDDTESQRPPETYPLQSKGQSFPLQVK